MKFLLKKSETNVILVVFIQDSSSTTGAGLGSLIHTSSITGGYVKRGGTGVALAVDEDVATEGTYQAPSTAAHVRIGTPANMISGVYELHFHNDLFTTADYVTISFSGALNMAPLLIEVQLTDVDLNTALSSSTVGTVTTLGSGAIDSILDDEVDNDGTAISLREANKIMLSILTAKSSGGGTSTLVFRDIADTKNRLVVSVDANGNRTAVSTRDGV